MRKTHLLPAKINLKALELAIAADPTLRMKKTKRGILITADATVVDAAYLNKYVAPMLTREYQNDNEGFIQMLPKVPAAAVGESGILMNKLIDNVTAIIGNSSAFTPVAHTKKNLIIEWDKIDTTLSKVTIAEVRGLTYDLQAELRLRHMRALKRKTRDYLVHALAPAANAAKEFVIDMEATMSYAEIVKAGTKLREINVDPSDCILILSPKHVEALAIQQGPGSAIREVLVSEKDGSPKAFAGFGGVYTHNVMPYYDTDSEKTAFGAVVAEDDRQASVIIHAPETVFHRENVVVFFKPKEDDTRSADPGTEFRLGGYFVADKIEPIGFVALLDAIPVVEEP
jgi:hypothetical protein